MRPCHGRTATIAAIVGLLLALTAAASGGGPRSATAQAGTPEADALPLACTGRPIVPALELVLAIRQETGSPDPATLDQVRQIVARRAEALAGDGCRIWTDGIDQVLVQFAGPAAPDANVAIQALAGTGLLEIVDAQGQVLPAGTLVETSLGSPQSSGIATPAAGAVYQTIVSGVEIVDAYVQQDPATAQDVVAFELDEAGSGRLCEFTTDNVGQPMAIVLDKETISSPQIQTPICGGQGQIAGLSAAEAQALVVQLLTGALPVPVEVVAIRPRGPLATPPA